MAQMPSARGEQASDPSTLRTRKSAPAVGGGLRAAKPGAGFPEELGALLGWKMPLYCGGGWDLRLSRSSPAPPGVGPRRPPGAPDARFVHCTRSCSKSFLLLTCIRRHPEPSARRVREYLKEPLTAVLESARAGAPFRTNLAPSRTRGPAGARPACVCVARLGGVSNGCVVPPGRGL